MGRNKNFGIEVKGSENPHDFQCRFLKLLEAECSNTAELPFIAAVNKCGYPEHYVYEMRKDYPEFRLAIDRICASHHRLASGHIVKTIYKKFINVDLPNPMVALKMLEFHQKQLDKYEPAEVAEVEDLDFRIINERDSLK